MTQCAKEVQKARARVQRREKVKASKEYHRLDHGGTWVPTRAQLKRSHGCLAYPTQHQYMHSWHADGKGPEPGTTMLIGTVAEAEEFED